MGFKDILVHVNVSRHCGSRLRVAAHLAKTFDAHLVGVFTSALSDIPFFMVEDIGLNAEPPARAWWLAEHDRAKSVFDACMREAGCAADWVELDEQTARMVPRHASYADLTVVGQLDPDELLPRPEYDIPERVPLESGRPALIVPYAGSFPTVGRRVLIAWNDSAQAARAVRDAFPFLKRAEAVTVATVRRSGSDDEDCKRLAAYLARHGIAATVRVLYADDADAANAILNQAADDGSDLIVMGAYSHTRAREAILGGATRAMFRHMTAPVLMSH